MLRENEDSVRKAIEKVALSNTLYTGSIDEELKEVVRRAWEENGYVSAISIEAFALFLSRYKLRYKPKLSITPGGMLQVMWKGPAGSSFIITFETRGNFFAEVRGATLLQHEEVEEFVSKLIHTSLDMGSVWGSKKKVHVWTEDERV